MYKYEYQVSDTGRSNFAVIDTDRIKYLTTMCECDDEDDARIIVAALDYLQENSTR